MRDLTTTTSSKPFVVFALLAACASSRGPSESTQTGNPPVLDERRIMLEVSADEVHITGARGAATPGGVKVEVKNLTTGDVIEGTAAKDGSFDLEVDGSVGDAFAVRATNADGTSSPVYVVRGGAAFGAGDDGTLTCDQYEELAESVIEINASEGSCRTAADCRVVNAFSDCGPSCVAQFVSVAGEQRLEAAIDTLNRGLCALAVADGCRMPPACPMSARLVDCVAGRCTAKATGGPALSCAERESKAEATLAGAIASADKRCVDSIDCTFADPQTVCHNACGTRIAVSIGGKRSIDLQRSMVNSGLCAAFDADGCQVRNIGCDPIAPPSGVRCEAGICIGTYDQPQPQPADAGVSECMSCFGESIAWGHVGGLTQYTDTSEIIPCARYRHSRSRTGSMMQPFTCERDLIACGERLASAGAVMSAFANPDVQAAFARAPLLFGSDPRPVDGQVMQIGVGNRIIEVGGSCEGAPPSCIPVPSGVQQLVELLDTIDYQLLGMIECANLPQ